MGLDTNGIKFLLSCKKNGISFDSVLMVGRQILNLDFEELKSNLKGFSLFHSDKQVRDFLEEDRAYSEGFFKFLGSKSIDSLDYSNYEGANVLHDMNLPIPDNFKAKYKTVLESGSIEHIFNFPVAIANCMEMVAEGGHLIIITPVNNIMGHGFYQFSPEVFYRILNEKKRFRNGADVYFRIFTGRKVVFGGRPKENEAKGGINEQQCYLFVRECKKN